jgi:uncharacterized membrane protein YfcA
MEFASIIVAMALAGAAGGLIAGLLGVGGGIIIVPVLEFVLGLLGVDSTIRMHVAVGTSLATIIPTSFASARAHHKAGAISMDLIRFWSPYIIVGTVAGALIAGQASGEVLYAVFGIVALLVAVKMILPLDDRVIADDVPRGVAGTLVPVCIGALSAMMGIGGGSMSVPTMTLCGRPIHQAVGTSALFGAFIAVPGTLGFIATGWGNPLLPPASLGYVNLAGFALIVPTTVLFAPIGARLAHRMPRRTLGLLFGAFLLVVAVRMVLRALG